DAFLVVFPVTPAKIPRHSREGGNPASFNVKESPYAFQPQARVGWDERSESQHPPDHKNVGFREAQPNLHPTRHPS
ncbi:MAG: hypothetical protein LBE22_09700, partial [Azoarcus sp.]|nr:hypothetical protein [Azoarcus sp.]